MKLEVLCFAIVLSFLPHPMLIAKEKAKDDQYGNFDEWKNRPKSRFTDAKKNFEKVKKQLLKNYYQKDLKEEDLYLAATKGMLNFLNTNDKKWNKLLSPKEWEEMQVEISGKVSGIGIVMQFDSKTGIANISDVLKNSPSAKAGVQPGDQVVTVDGKLYKGKQFRDLVHDIRGPSGKKVTLGLLRGGKIIQRPISRGKISWEPVNHHFVDHNGKKIALLGITYFTEMTAKLVKKALLDINKSKAKALIIDLRGNSGGLFDQAVATLELFIDKGATIARTSESRSSEVSIKAKTKPQFSKIPILVLVNNYTASGAELFAASLKENLTAKIAGSSTMGKWNMQTVETLSNKYAIKYTIKAFHSPKGRSFTGKGLSPDVNLAGEELQFPVYSLSKGLNKKGFAGDQQMLSALKLVDIMI